MRSSLRSIASFGELRPSSIPLHAVLTHSVIKRSYIGYSNANYVLSEMRDPIRTIKKAAPIALSAITATYLLVNVAYFIVVDKKEILASGQAVT